MAVNPASEVFAGFPESSKPKMMMPPPELAIANDVLDYLIPFAR